MNNHIENIEITNFKSIRHQKIERCKRINVFIGYPNVGKSAILEAISSLSYLQKDFNEPYNKLCRLKESFEIFFDANTKQDTIIRCREDISVQFKYISESDLEVFVQSSKEVPAPHPYRRFILRNGEIAGSSTGEANGTIKVKKYSFNNKYNDFKTNGTTLFSPHGENLVDIIHLHKNIRKEVADLFKFYGLKLLIDPSTNSIRGFKQLDEEIIFTIPYHQMADTLQRLIFHKAAVSSNENTVLLFEEPEAHMFPPYIRKFTGDLIYDKQNGNQYFISTHSPFVLDDLIEEVREDLAIYLVSLKDGETMIKRLSDNELGEVHKFHVDLFFNIESYVD